ncbi:uncharacterized protein LOC121814946 [Haplochromis burtoni]|uniref:uncharacterized protein LOC121814946 n=1 Tax=Haplochromis burtoni TaxID=8153 RepID=UPI001C2D8429|nr:uncharacterized protein LOC121814946 [Haplochromis burtoni]
MINTPTSLITPGNDMDMLKLILQQKVIDLDCEYKEHNIIDPEIDSGSNFLSTFVKNCNYFTQEQYEKEINLDGKLSLIHFNRRSMYSNFDFIKDYLQQFSRPFSIIAITETWFNVDKGIDFCLNGYDLKYMNRLNKAGGGVAIYVHNSINYNVVTTMSMAIDGILECLTIEIMNEKKRNVIISCIYRTPSSSIDTFNEWIEKTFASVNQKLLFICGDFNIDLLNPTRLKAIDDFTDTMYSLSLYPTITKPSRITSHSATIIDNIFTNVMDFQINSGLLVCDITDHLPVFTLCDCDLKKIDTKIMIAKRTINEEAIHAFNFDLAQQDWSSVYEESDVDKAYDNFLDIFTDVATTPCRVHHRNQLEPSKRQFLTTHSQMEPFSANEPGILPRSDRNVIGQSLVSIFTRRREPRKTQQSLPPLPRSELYLLVYKVRCEDQGPQKAHEHPSLQA